MALAEGDVYRVIGENGFRRLVGAFYRRVPADDILGGMYPPDDLEAAEDRLVSFLIQRFGGPDAYSQARGHPRLRMRHAPFAIDIKARHRWIELMTAALDEIALPAEVRALLEPYFHSTATFMINQEHGV